MALVKAPTSRRIYLRKNRQKAVGWVKGTFKMQDEETMWYENYELVQEYLDGGFSKNATVAEKDPKTLRFSWLEIMKKSFHIK
jgi:hypothetical protein